MAATPTTPVATDVTTIAAGGNLWQVAADALGAAWGRAPANAEIVPYWRRLIDTNRSRLARADDPDLVFPGQEVELPSIPAAP
jgi:nucleoid-associated protein YgaU